MTAHECGLIAAPIPDIDSEAPHEPGLSNRTVRYIHTIIHAALRDALRWNRVARNVANAATPAAGLDAATLTTQGHSYPVVTFSVEVLDADGGLCAEHSLGAPDSGVQVDYVGSADGALVATLLPPAGEVYICGSPAPIDCVAGPTVDGQPLPVTVSAAATPGTFTVTTGAQSTTVALDPGFTLGAACRQDSCCEGD